MENYITVMISAVLSGVFATVITLWWQNKNEKMKIRRDVFTTLMAYRFRISHSESVKALNCVLAVFYDCENVKNAWLNFKNAADKKPFNVHDLDDAHIRLLEEIAKTLKYKNINWKDLKGYYYPEALAQEFNDTDVLRKAQIEMAILNINANSNNE